MNGGITSAPFYAGERSSSVPSSGAGGERTERKKSEWEELETLTKDELIIELVRMNTLYSILRSEKGDECVWPAKPRKFDADGNLGERTTHEWAEKIALYGAMHPKDGAFYSCDLMDYGMTEDQAEEICEELREKSLLKLPEGTEYEPEGDWE